MICSTALAATAGAAGWPNGASLVSFVGGTLGNQSSFSSVMSADGNYVVFFSASDNLSAAAPQGGIFRKNLGSGELELVAKRQIVIAPPPSPVQDCGAGHRITISGDGRYVAFDNGGPLVAADTNGSRDVYRRDMTKPLTDGAADNEFTLISARDGGSTPATYVGGGACALGSRLGNDAGRLISDDGTRVLFMNEVATDLPARASADAARGQLFLRDTTADSTLLVTSTIDDPDTVDVEPGGEPLPASDESSPPPLATLSGDGSTVAWAGEFARIQTRLHTVEVRERDNDGVGKTRVYMWKRIADGAAAKTRRVAGLADLDDPKCDPDDATVYLLNGNGFGDPEDPYDPRLDNGNGTSPKPCQGKFLANNEDGGCVQAPALSTDGYTVAFISCFEPRSYNPAGDGNIPTGADVFTADMRPGVSRKDGVREITHALNPDLDGSANAASGAVKAVAISGNGKRVGFVTRRSQFPVLTNPLASGPLPGVYTTPHAYVIDSGCTDSPSDDIIEWATKSGFASITGPAGSYLTDGGVYGGISLDGSGDNLTFNSYASNLVLGAGGNPRIDVFTNRRVNGTCGSGGGGGGGATTPPPPPPPPPPPLVTPLPTITLPALKGLANGTAALPIVVSSAGSVRFTATAKLPNGKKKKKKKLKATVVGSGSGVASAAGTVRLVLKLSTAAKRYLKEKGKLAVAVKVTFTNLVGATAQRTFALKFKAKKKAKSRKRSR